MQNQEISGAVQTWWGEAKQLAPALRKDFGGRFKHVVTVFGPAPEPLSVGDTRLKASGAYVDPEITDMLSLDMVRGDRNALRDQSSIILSASVAKKPLRHRRPHRQDRENKYQRATYRDRRLHRSPR